MRIFSNNVLEGIDIEGFKSQTSWMRIFSNNQRSMVAKKTINLSQTSWMRIFSNRVSENCRGHYLQSQTSWMRIFSNRFILRELGDQLLSQTSWMRIFSNRKWVAGKFYRKSLKPHEWGYFPTEYNKEVKKAKMSQTSWMRIFSNWMWIMFYLLLLCLKPHEWGYFPTAVKAFLKGYTPVSNLMNEDIFQQNKKGCQWVFRWPCLKPHEWGYFPTIF